MKMMRVRSNYFVAAILIVAFYILPKLPHEIYERPGIGEILFYGIAGYFFLCLCVEISIFEKTLTIKYPFRFWSKLQQIPLEDIKSVEASGGKTENLFVYKNINGKEKKLVFEFFTFRYSALKKLVVKINDLIESSQGI